MRAAAAGFLARAVRVVGAALLFSAIAAAAAFGGMHGRRYLLTSPRFAVERITFEGTVHASREELLRLSGLAVGDNIFELDSEAAESGMASHPWVQRVYVERDYPRHIAIRVLEHTPAALAEMERLYFVNEQGKPFKKVSPGEEVDLPILSGVTREAYLADEAEVEGLFRRAIEALAVYREEGLEKTHPVSEVKVDAREGLTFYCGNDAVAVALGQENYREKFERLQRLFGELQRRGARAEVIRLDNRTRPGWVAVQLAGQ
ncbi:MAG: cell division protein FtsQ/DivIB [Myxococcales bacterium]